jgi:hypothetical protein
MTPFFLSISDMNYKIRLCLITSLFALAICQDTPGTVIKGDDSVDCYHCDIEDNCGYFTGDECLDGIDYEDEDTIGGCEDLSLP